MAREIFSNLLGVRNSDDFHAEKLDAVNDVLRSKMRTRSDSGTRASLGSSFRFKPLPGT